MTEAKELILSLRAVFDVLMELLRLKGLGRQIVSPLL